MTNTVNKTDAEILAELAGERIGRLIAAHEGCAADFFRIQIIKIPVSDGDVAFAHQAVVVNLAGWQGGRQRASIHTRAQQNGNLDFWLEEVYGRRRSTVVSYESLSELDSDNSKLCRLVERLVTMTKREKAAETENLKKLRNAGLLLYGYDWRNPLAREIQVCAKTMRNWISGTHPVPDSAIRQLEAVLHQQADETEIKLRRIREFAAAL